jgi:hypothetical protein
LRLSYVTVTELVAAVPDIVWVSHRHCTGMWDREKCQVSAGRSPWNLRDDRLHLFDKMFGR